MKQKIISIFALSMALLVACNKTDNESVQIVENQLTFEVNEISETKGTLISSFADGSQIGVYAYRTPSGGSAPTTPDVMSNQLVSLSGSSWVYSPTQYWSTDLDDEYDFYAYYPYTESTINGVMPSNVSGELSINYVVPTDCASQPDLMIAKTTVNSKSGGVPLYFEHALAAISFQVQGDADQTITAISISNIYTKGTLTYGTKGVEWKTTGDRTDVNYNAKIDGTIVPSETPESLTTTDGYLMMIPQDIPTDGITVTVTIDETETLDLTITPDKVTDGKWEAGEPYIYVVNVEDDGNWIYMIERDDVTKWKEENGDKEEYLVTDYFDFKYSTDTYKAYGTNWMQTSNVITAAAPEYGYATNNVPDYGILEGTNVSDDVLPKLIELCGANIRLPIREELMYIWIFKGDNDILGFHWSSTHYTDKLDSRWMIYFNTGKVDGMIAGGYTNARAVKEIYLP